MSDNLRTDKDTKRYLIKYYIYAAIAIIWMAVIFINSSFEGVQSSGLSELVIRWMLKLSELVNDSPVIISFRDLIESDGFHLFIRKAAHFIEFGILGLLLYLALCIIERLKISPFYRAVCSVLLSLLYAVSDEVHQLFVPGRNGSAADVAIDLAGIIVFVGFVFILNKTERNKHVRKENT